MIMFFRYVHNLNMLFFFTILWTFFLDGSRRSSSGHGFLELQSNPNPSRSLLMLISGLQNVSGRTLVGLRFWNQVRPFYFHLS